MLIHDQLFKIQAEINPIAKDKVNSMQKFNYRGIDDVYNALHELFVKHRVLNRCEVIREYLVSAEKADKGKYTYNRVYVFRYHFTAEDGSEYFTDASGEGSDSSDKASNKAMSAAHKYALLQMFMIPTEDMVEPDSVGEDRYEDSAGMIRGSENITALKDAFAGAWAVITDPKGRKYITNVYNEMKAKLS